MAIEAPAAEPVKRPRSFAGDVLKLASGTVLAQILSVLSAPFLAHLFAPAAFGDAALFVAITGIISSFVGMRYELSIVLPERDIEAVNAMAVTLCFVLIVSGATALLVVTAGTPLLRILHAEGIAAYLWLLPLMILFNGIYAALSYWSVRKNYYGHFTVAQVVSTFFFVATQIIAGLMGHGTRGAIIYATVGAAGVSTLILLVTSWWPWATLFFRNVRRPQMLEMLKRYASFPKFSTVSELLHNVSALLPTFFLAAFFSPTIVGFYAMGNRLLRIPVNLIGTNVATVFFQRVSEAKNSGSVTASVERVFRYLSAITVFPCLLLCLIGKDVFVVTLGSKWTEAGVYAQILSPWLLFWFVSIPLGTALSVLEKQALELRMFALILITRVISLAIGGAVLRDARWTLGLFSATGALVFAYYCFVVLRQCGIPIRRIVRVMAENIALFIPAGIIVAILTYAVPARPIVVVAVSVVLTALYYLNLIRTDATFRSLLIGLVQRLAPQRAQSSIN
jgi:O-antigen/teichoic acid export membrane protein